MNHRLFNENIYKQVEYWKKNGEYSYVAVLNHLLLEHTRKLCYPNGDQFIYFPKKKYSEQAISTVLDSLGIKYSSSTLPGYIAVALLD